MKLAMSFLAVSLVSITGFACPTLTGNWSCGNSMDKMQMNLISVRSNDAEYLIQTVDVGTSVETTLHYVLGVGKQQYRSTTYSAMCGADSITVTAEEVIGKDKTNVEFRIKRVNHNELALDVLSINDPRVKPSDLSMKCTLIDPLH